MGGLCKECGCDAEGLVASLDEMDTQLGKAQAENELLATKCQNYFVEVNSLEAENAQCKEAFAAVSAGKPMGPIVEKHLIQNMQRRITELEAACIVKDIDIKNLRAEVERLRTELDNERGHYQNLAASIIPAIEDAERYRLHRTGDHSDVLMEVPPKSDNWEPLTGEALDKATDAAREGE